MHWTYFCTVIACSTRNYWNIFNTFCASSIVFSSSSDNFLKSFIYEILSSICSILLIPDNTVITPSKFAANFIAHDATETFGFAFLNTSATCIIYHLELTQSQEFFKKRFHF